MKQLNISSFVTTKPPILIGQGNIDLIISRVSEGGKNAPVLSKSELVTHGKLCNNYLEREDEKFTLFVLNEYNDLDELDKYSFENLGVKYYESSEIRSRTSIIHFKSNH